MSAYTSLVRLIFLILVFFSFAASAQDTFRLTVEKFGSRDKPQTLFNTISLELEFEEDIVVSPSEKFFDNLDVPIQTASEEEIATALIAAGQDVFLRAVFLEEDSEAVILLYRSLDGAVIFASRFAVDYALLEARTVVVDELLKALRNATLRDPIEREKLEELGVKFDSSFLQVAPDPDLKTIDAPPKEEPQTTEKPEAPKGAKASDARGQVTFALAPTIWRYKACSKQGVATHFFCQDQQGAHAPTQTNVTGLIGFDLGASYQLLPFLGASVQASYFRSSVSVDIPANRGSYDPASITVQGGEANIALFSHRALGKSKKYHVGGRAGLQLQSISTSVHAFALPETPDVKENRSLLPSSLMIGAFAGAQARALVTERVRVALGFDLNLGSYSEKNDQIWSEDQSPLALGLSAQALVDVAITGNWSALLGIRAATFAAKGEGKGSRLTLWSGDAFEDGMVVSTRFIPKAGIAWRF